MTLSSGKPPVIIVGGSHNALSIARSLAAAGVEVHAINQPDADVRYSRLCRWIDVRAGAEGAQQAWAAYLLGPESDHLRGAVLLAASDEAIEVLMQHRAALAQKFRLDISHPSAQLCMLDKLQTYQAARAAGVPTPKFWAAETREQIEELEPELVFPLIVKPLRSYEFVRIFFCKFLVVQNFSELLSTFDKVQAAGVRTLLVEFIPGADHKLCSYYTYLDEKGNNLFDFTKRIIRRYPVSMGLGTYHITDQVPGVKEASLRLLRHVGLAGLANVEFKLDERDGQLKLIECNARFTAVNCLLVSSGINLPLFVYKQVIGEPEAAPASYRTGLRLWDPPRDFLSFWQLRQGAELDFAGWLRSVLHRQTFPVFRWNDPMPALVSWSRMARKGVSRLMKKVFGQSGEVRDGMPLPRQSQCFATAQRPAAGAGVSVVAEGETGTDSRRLSA